MDTQRTESGKQ